jgi:aspartate racemase
MSAKSMPICPSQPNRSARWRIVFKQSRHDAKFASPLGHAFGRVHNLQGAVRGRAMAQRRLIGVLGGMGPLATVDFMQKVIEATPAARDQDHVPMLVRSIPQVPDRVTAIFEGHDEPFPHLLQGLRALQTAGAELIVMPCNTAHAWYDRLAASADIPFLHIADAVARSLTGANRRPIALMATAATVRVGFYQRYLAAAGLEVILPDADTQRRVTEAIHDVKAGNLIGAQQAADAAAHILIDRGASRILLACTELPLAFRSSHHKDMCLDATMCLAEATVTFSCRSDTNSAEVAMTG